MSASNRKRHELAHELIHGEMQRRRAARVWNPGVREVAESSRIGRGDEQRRVARLQRCASVGNGVAEQTASIDAAFA